MEPGSFIDPYLTRPDRLVLESLLQDVERTESIPERPNTQKVDSGYSSAADQSPTLDAKANKASPGTAPTQSDVLQASGPTDRLLKNGSFAVEK